VLTLASHPPQPITFRYLSRRSLEHNPPVPTLQAQQPGQAANPHPLHTFLGFVPDKHIVSMSLRDPHDAREMPPNGNAHVCAYSLRGVRKVRLIHIPPALQPRTEY
jgi:hypothetical protein